MRITVTVKPGSKHNEVKEKGNEIVIYTTARPENNQANETVIKLLARHLHVPPSTLRILRGAKTRRKLIEFPSHEDPIRKRT